jgi:hypothetical protein
MSWALKGARHQRGRAPASPAPVGFLANALGLFELEFQWLRIVTVVFMGIVEYGNRKRVFLAGVKLEVIVVSGIKFS